MICYIIFYLSSSLLCSLLAIIEFAAVSFVTLLGTHNLVNLLFLLLLSPNSCFCRFASPDSPDRAMQPCSITRQLTVQWLSVYLAWGESEGGMTGPVPCASIIHQELKCNMPYQSTDVVSFLRRGFVTTGDPAGPGLVVYLLLSEVSIFEAYSHATAARGACSVHLSVPVGSRLGT